jgi:hypothetical protein
VACAVSWNCVRVFVPPCVANNRTYFFQNRSLFLCIIWFVFFFDARMLCIFILFFHINSLFHILVTSSTIFQLAFVPQHKITWFLSHVYPLCYQRPCLSRPKLISLDMRMFRKRIKKTFYFQKILRVKKDIMVHVPRGREAWRWRGGGIPSPKLLSREKKVLRRKSSPFSPHRQNSPLPVHYVPPSPNQPPSSSSVLWRPLTRLQLHSLNVPYCLPYICPTGAPLLRKCFCCRRSIQ